VPSRTVCRSRIRGNVSRRATAILAAFLGLAWACPTSSLAQALPGTDEAARILVQDLKQDPRGPFQGIRWFCPDGSIIAAASRCVEPGGIQHGLLRDAVVRLQRERGIHLGQVLAGTPFESFLDDANRFSRLKQYQMERYLIRTDDGWILRKARYYRGAYQAEDEEDWGRRFLEWALGRDELVRSWFFVLREATRDVPHAATTDLIQDVRAGAKNLSDAYPPFLDLRVKIHGQPEASDTVRVAAFRRQQMQRMPPSVGGMLDRLLVDMRRLYGADPGEHLRRLVSRVPAESEVGRLVRSMDLAAMTPRERTEMLADLVFRCREQILVTGNGRQRLRLMDTSIAAEALLFLTASDWTPGSPRDLLSKAAALARTAAGTGLIELWEWQELRPELAIEAGPLTITESDLKRRATAARRAPAAVARGAGPSRSVSHRPPGLQA